jgi:hypothetical protein
MTHITSVLLYGNRWFQNPNTGVRQIEAVPANERSLKASRALAIIPSDSPAGSGTAVDTSNNLGQPIAGILANPLHISTPGDAPSPTQTLPAREVFHEIQEAIRPLASAIQTQEQLDDFRESLSSIRRVFLGLKAMYSNSNTSTGICRKQLTFKRQFIILNL